MTDIAKITIEDEVNIHIQNLSLPIRKEMSKTVEYFIPGARYSNAYKLGRWNGMQSYCTIGGRTYLNILDKLLPIIQSHNIDIEIDDKRNVHNFIIDEIDDTYLEHLTWPVGHRAAGQPIKLRDYQVTAVNELINNFQGISVAPTSSGKTIITATLSKVVEKYGRTIVIVPNKNLVYQTEEDYRNIGLDVGVLFGDRKEYTKTHTICTWQSLNVLDKKNKDCLDDDQLAIFLDNLIAVIVDETHLVKNTGILHKLLTTVFRHIPIRWGLTGTIPEEEHNKMGLISAIGPLIGSLSAKELQDSGFLAKCHVNILHTQDTVSYKNYHEELKHLVTNKIRIKWLAEKIKEISKTGNTLVLVDRIMTGEMLVELIPEASFVSGKMKSTDRKEEYKEINLADNGILIATAATTAVGISINRIFNLVLLEPGKSFVKVIQSIGRGLRMADDKDSVQIYDIASRCKFSNNHLSKRKKFYKEVQYPFSVSKVIY